MIIINVRRIKRKLSNVPTCAFRDLSLPPDPLALPGGVALHGVAGDAGVVGELAGQLDRAVDGLLGLTALGST